MKKFAALAAFSLFIFALVSACGNDNSSEPISAGGTASTTVSSGVIDAGTSVSKDFPPSPSCDPTGTTGVINGTVRDPFQDFVVFGAGVTLTREGTIPQETSTDEEGTYRFCALEPGTYQVSAYAVGFETMGSSTAVGVEVKAGSSKRADLELSLGSQEIPSNVGAVKGSVISAKSSEGIEGVLVEALVSVQMENGQIQLGDTVNATSSDANGDFFLSLDIGTYTLVFSKEGFRPKNIIAVTIKSDEVSRLRRDSVQLFPLPQ